MLFASTPAPGKKPVPVTVIVSARPPAVTVEGEMLVIVGTGGATGNGNGLDITPPGFVTVTGKVTACCTRFAGTTAVNCVLLTNVVTSELVPSETVDPGTKLLPFTVNVNAGPPVGTVDGEILVIIGPATMVSVTAFDTEPPVLAAVICAVPGCEVRFAGTVAVSCVELTKVVVRAVAFNDTVAPDRKLVPLTVRVITPPPAETIAGEMLLIVGVGTVMVKVTALEPRLPMLTTVICAVPGCVIRSEVTAATSCVGLMKLVFRVVVFQMTAEPAAKPVPVTVKENAGPPADAVAGEMLLITTIGGGGSVTEKATALDPIVPLLTTTLYVPSAATRLAVTTAVNWVALKKVVVRLVVFQETTEVGRKPVPTTFRVNAGLPASAVDGASVRICGVGGWIVNGSALEEIAALVTVTDTVPGCATNAAVTGAFNCVGLAKVVGSAVEFHMMVAP